MQRKQSTVYSFTDKSNCVLGNFGFLRKYCIFINIVSFMENLDFFNDFLIKMKIYFCCLGYFLKDTANSKSNNLNFYYVEIYGNNEILGTNI
jgi:hypothetical protein